MKLFAALWDRVLYVLSNERGVLGTGTTYEFTVGVKLDFEDTIYVLTPSDVPMLGTLNGTENLPPGAYRNSILGKTNTFAKKFEWEEEELIPARSTLNGAIIVGATALIVATGHGKRFQKGHVILLDDELMRVTAVATDTLTVTRAFNGTTDAAHSNGVAVVSTGTALPEGSDPEQARFDTPAGLFNVCQIFGPYAVDISGSNEAVARKGGQSGVASQYDRQSMLRARELWIEVEQAYLYGKRLDSSTDKWRTTGGLTFFIVTNKNSTTTQIDYSSIRDLMQDAYDNGGVIDTLMGEGTQVNKVDDFQSAQIRIGLNEQIRGAIVSQVRTHYGIADLVLNRHIRVADFFGLDRQWLEDVSLRPMIVEPLGKTGDHLESEILTERGFKARMEKRHFRFSSLAA